MITDRIEFEYFIKSKIAKNGLTVSSFSQMFNTSQQNFSQRLKKATFDYIEISKIADLLGYDIIWQKR